VNQIYPDAGLLMWMDRMVADDVVYHLFVNNHTPTRTTTLASLTEATWSGYGPIQVFAADFTLSGVVLHVATIQAPPISFDNGSGIAQSAYGYFVTDVLGLTLLAVGRFDGAPLTKASGSAFVLTPTLSILSQHATA
jgi:hypothetical protein